MSYFFNSSFSGIISQSRTCCSFLSSSLPTLTVYFSVSQRENGLSQLTSEAAQKNVNGLTCIFRPWTHPHPPTHSSVPAGYLPTSSTIPLVRRHVTIQGFVVKETFDAIMVIQAIVKH
ncbi:uncharacterized protein LOC143022650 [Oratosquilla oratoria]|uniref:uncharacterized protein LOC143022650 n=1 Tax=Oratosquilla oratoria TaxID=337810 RepID=UPI003F774E43